MAKSILIFIVILFTTNIALSKRVMLDSLELSSIKNFYYSTDSSRWYRDDFSKLYFGKIYPNEDFIHSNLPKVRITFDRDTTIKGEEIGIYKFKILNFDEMIVSPFSQEALLTLDNGTFISGTFSKLEELRLSGCDDLNNDEPFYAPNLKIFKCHESELTSTINLNQFQNLEELDFFMVWNNFDLSNLNLPKCKIFKIIGSNLSTTLNIDNMENIEEFQIREYYFSVWDYQDPLSMTLKGTDIYQVLNKLKNVRILSLRNTYIEGELPELNFPNLEYLDIYRNQFHGKFPVLNTPKLKYLDINTNNFDDISDTITLENLEHLDMSKTSIKKNLPVLILPNLKYIRIFASYFSGELRQDLFQSKKLEYVNLQDAELSGTIDFNFYSDSLKYLNLSSNYFSGKMPNVIAPNLFKLNFAYNQFNAIFDSLKVNSSTMVIVRGKTIGLNIVAKMCQNAIEQGIIDSYISPSHILEYSAHNGFDSLYATFLELDFYQDTLYNDLYLELVPETFFNESTNKFEIDGLDTSIFTYKVFKYDGIDFVETGLSIWDYVPEVGNYQIRAYSKYCDFEYKYPSVNIKKLSVESQIVDCKNIIPIEYYDLLGNKLNQTEIYNRQIVVRYKCLETGELFHKLEIKEPR